MMLQLCNTYDHKSIPQPTKLTKAYHRVQQNTDDELKPYTRVVVYQPDGT